MRIKMVHPYDMFLMIDKADANPETVGTLLEPVQHDEETVYEHDRDILRFGEFLYAVTTTVPCSPEGQKYFEALKCASS